jgi:hypothetical protein
MYGLKIFFISTFECSACFTVPQHPHRTHNCALPSSVTMATSIALSVTVVDLNGPDKNHVYRNGGTVTSVNEHIFEDQRAVLENLMRCHETFQMLLLSFVCLCWFWASFYIKWKGALSELCVCFEYRSHVTNFPPLYCQQHGTTFYLTSHQS